MANGGAAAVDDRLSGLSDAALLDVVLAGVARLADTALSAAVDDDALRASVAVLARCESAVHAEKLRRVARSTSGRRTGRRGNVRRRTGWAAPPG